MASRRRRQKTKSTKDKIVGRLAEAWGRVTGNRKAKAGGKGLRARGKARSAASSRPRTSTRGGRPRAGKR